MSVRVTGIHVMLCQTEAMAQESVVWSAGKGSWERNHANSGWLVLPLTSILLECWNIGS